MCPMLCLNVLLIAAPVPAEKVESDQLQGEWEFVKSSGKDKPAAGMKLALKVEGKAELLTVALRGESTKQLSGTWKLDKNQLRITSLKWNGLIQVDIFDVKSVSPKELVLVDSDKNTLEFRKAELDPKLLVGVWEVTDAPDKLPKGTTMEFTAENKLKMGIGGISLDVGTYAVEGKILTIKPKQGKEGKARITKLTATELEMKDDAEPELLKMKRVEQEPKKDQ